MRKYTAGLLIFIIFLNQTSEIFSNPFTPYTEMIELSPEELKAETLPDENEENTEKTETKNTPAPEILRYLGYFIADDKKYGVVLHGKKNITVEVNKEYKFGRIVKLEKNYVEYINSEDQRKRLLLSAPGL